MKNTTVRISIEAQRLLREMAEQDKQPMQAIIEKALQAYRSKRFLEQVNDAYAAERAVPYGQPALADELASLDGTLADGLDPADSWTEESLAGSKGKKGHKK